MRQRDFLVVIGLGVLACDDAFARPIDGGCPSFGPTDHTAFGLETRPDTSLARSRLGFSTRLTHTQSSEENIGHYAGEKAYFAFSTRNESAHGITAFVAYDHAMHAEAEDRFGNLSAMLGYRNSTFLIADGARFGWALRMGTGVALVEHRPSVGNVIAARMPFDVMAHAHERPVIVSAEARFEMVGCSGAFAHARVDNVTWRDTVDGSRTRFDAISASLTLGGYPHPTLGVALDIGTQWGVTDDGVIPNRITRVGTLLDFAALRWLSLVGQFAALSGDVAGAEAALRVVARF